MSNFACDECGAICSDTPNGFVTGCKHYPPDAGAIVSDQKHTPEPWDLDWFRNHQQTYDLCESDVVRIVACVNACAGMDDPVAAIEKLREQVDVAWESANHFGEIAEQRAQELANLRAANAALVEAACVAMRDKIANAVAMSPRKSDLQIAEHIRNNIKILSIDEVLAHREALSKAREV